MREDNTKMVSQLQNPAPISRLMAYTQAVSAGRLEHLTYESRLEGSAEPLSVYALNTLIGMSAGTAMLRFVAGADPAFVAAVAKGAARTSYVYRRRDHMIVSTGLLGQPPEALYPIAASLLTAEPDSAFGTAYAAFLAALAGSDTAELDRAALSAAIGFAAAIESDFDPAGLTWQFGASPDIAGEVDEVKEVGALSLDGLFADPATFAAYAAGNAPDYAVLRSSAATVGAEAPMLASDAFIGEQLGVAISFMAAGKHILHHGPTGTGKSYVWNKAMLALYPDFDPDTYPYFVHGSGGLEDIDFIGQIMPDPSGAKVWIDGPVVRAMRDGKRLKVEEINRLPGSMLNILLGAMDYGRIAVTRHTGEIIVARPGFAVDAMANIGREYTATEELDPAIMRRFQRKIEYDFLAPAAEISLLRSRHPTIEREDAETLVRIANAIRDAYENGGADLDVDLYVSPAALIETAGMVADGYGIEAAITATWLPDVARTKSKREGVRQVIEANLRERKRKVSKAKK